MSSEANSRQIGSENAQIEEIVDSPAVDSVLHEPIHRFPVDGVSATPRESL
jgi:hypothetical protein